MDRFGCPADIGECYEYYIGVVKHEVAKAGIKLGANVAKMEVREVEMAFTPAAKS